MSGHATTDPNSWKVAERRPLVWNIQSGTWNDVSLENLTVVAVMSAKNNLAIETKTRKSVLYMDPSTTSRTARRTQRPAHNEIR